MPNTLTEPKKLMPDPRYVERVTGPTKRDEPEEPRPPDNRRRRGYKIRDLIKLPAYAWQE